MGKFEDSFKRELGKNSGKVVSNILFGDMHSTPYRRVGQSAPVYREPRVTKSEMLHEQKMAQIDAEETRQRKERLLAIDKAVLQNVDTVASIRIPNQKEELLDLMSELSIQVEANEWSYGNSDEAKIRNKYCKALLEKFKQGLFKLKSIAPSEHQIAYFENILKKAEKNANKDKNKKRIKIAVFLVIIIFILLFIWAGIISSDGYLDFGEALLTVFVPILNVLFTIAIFGGVIWALVKFVPKIVTKIKANKLQKTINIQESLSTEHGQQQKKEEEQKHTPIPENSIFIDLNENNHIEIKLSGIWGRYRNSVDKQIIDRKPIFSADGVKDSILFVGVNPSYNPNDDKIFVHSGDDQSLMYGSLYQIPDAPSYFKVLEDFADRVGCPYSHINLLYARENNRDLLLHQNHNFIREQLELSYDTILNIKPKAIIFFTDYCKNLIFTHWINEATEKLGTYILNGTNIPVFFTDDITTMEDTAQFALIQKIKFITKK